MKKKSFSARLLDLKVEGESLTDLFVAREGETVFKALTEGECFDQVCKGKLHPCILRLDPNCHTMYMFKAKGKTQGKLVLSIDINQVTEIRTGFLTQELLTHHRKLGLKHDHVFSIYVLQNDATVPLIVDLSTENQLYREWWVHGLNVLVDVMCDLSGEAFSLMKPWTKHLSAKEAKGKNGVHFYYYQIYDGSSKIQCQSRLLFSF